MDKCGDNRFEIIEKAKQDLLNSTNIDSSKDEMKVLDNFLFRCWQMGWLNQYNLTSDAEEEEEFLTVPRNDVVELYQEVQKTISQCKGTALAVQSVGIRNVLWSFFGSKCLSDDVDSSEPNVDSSHDNVDSSRGNVDSLEHLESKANSDYTPIPEKTVVSKWDKTEPNSDGLNEDNFAKSEPKFKVGELCMRSGDVARVLEYNPKHEFPYTIHVLRMNLKTIASESDLEPYTEPDGDSNASKSVRLSEPEEESYIVVDCDKCTEQGKCDKLLRRSQNHDRLQIAAMAMQGILSNSDWSDYRGGNDQEVRMNIAKASFGFADALLTEFEKGKNG